MKKQFSILSAVFMAFGLATARAQSHGPHFGGAMDKLFGSNQTYTAKLELHTTNPAGKEVVIPGKISFDSGESRFEMNMAEVKGGHMPPDIAAHMKSMGLDEVVSISIPKQKTAYLIYPDAQSYVANQMTDEASAAADNYKVETTKLGTETVNGHRCTKNKVVVTDEKGNKHEFTTWDATDLKKFPVKIESSENGQSMTMVFKNVSLTKPPASDFAVPSGCTKYDNVQSMMQAIMMKKMGGSMGGMPPH